MVDRDVLKQQVKDHWERETCGTRYSASTSDRVAYFRQLDAARYRQDPMIQDFARFEESGGRRVLELGLGTGADFCRWVEAGADASGRDLTHASVELVKERLELFGLNADVAVGDAEALDFPDETFDIYYSWGVLHHTPDTEHAIAEAHRVLKPGGTLKIMLYHYPSVACFLIWIAHDVTKRKLRGPRTAIAESLESPGTKVYTRKQAISLMSRQFPVDGIIIRNHLGAADLMIHRPSSRYQQRWVGFAQRIYPRWFVRTVLKDRFGTVMTIEATKAGRADG